MLGEKITELRHALKMTKQELAHRAGVSLSTVRNWEQNNSQPSSDIIVDLCRALCIDPNTLFSFENHMVIYADHLTENDRVVVNALVQSLQNKNIDLENSRFGRK